ncbi:MAG: CBS domain-containing protein [Planctomycetaceae bacterium]|nr:CBS domain-containing protein [Planctomycetaceae bacterium]
MPKNALTAQDIMTTKVISVTPDQDLFDVIGLFIKHKISGAPVVDRAGRYLGVFTERTSIKLLMDAMNHGTPTNRIEPFIDSDAVTVSADTDLLTIAQILQETQYRRLPVLKNGKVIGLISRRDVLQAAHKLMELEQPQESTFLYLSLIHERSELTVG